MFRIKLYGTPTCPHCKQAKRFLTENNFDFEDFDVSSDREKADEMREKSGAMSVPVIEIDGKIIVGFHEATLRKALNL